MNDPDSPDNKNTQSRKNDTQKDDEQDDIKRWRLTEDKEFRGAREQIKERLSDREIPHDKEVQAGKRKSAAESGAVERAMPHVRLRA